MRRGGTFLRAYVKKIRRSLESGNDIATSLFLSSSPVSPYCLHSLSVKIFFFFLPGRWKNKGIAGILLLQPYCESSWSFISSPLLPSPSSRNTNFAHVFTWVFSSSTSCDAGEFDLISLWKWSGTGISLVEAHPNNPTPLVNTSFGMPDPGLSLDVTQLVASRALDLKELSYFLIFSLELW